MLLDKDIQKLDMEIQTAISKAMNGNDPEMIIKIDDPKFNLEVYQQIISKVYAVTRHRVYQQIQKKIRATKAFGKGKKKDALSLSQSMNDSVLSNMSVAIGEEDLNDLIKDLDIEAIRVEVFRLYDINFGLDAQLALRKLQVLEAEDVVFQNYLECLKEAHDRFLSYIFQGHVFGKMQQNPMHSSDLNYGVPYEFNLILDELLDDNQRFMNEEEYKLQMNFSMNMSHSVAMHTPSHISQIQPEEPAQRMLTEVEENKDGQYEASSKTSEQASEGFDPNQIGPDQVGERPNEKPARPFPQVSDDED